MEPVRGGEDVNKRGLTILSSESEVVVTNMQTSRAPAPGRSAGWWVIHLLWWSAPLLALITVLWTSYAALSERRYASVNGNPSELLAGHSAGQSFVARYSGLSGVELWIGTYGRGADPSRAELVLHLRATPGKGPDLAIARLLPTESIAENSWHLFSFPPIDDSQDKAFYVDVESPDATPGNGFTIFWWRQVAGGDPYQHGTAYLDGKPQHADLAFGLHYSTFPVLAWAQLARAASANFPLSAMLTLGVLSLAGTAWVTWQLWLMMREPKRRVRWLRRWSLPVALGAALIVGVTYMLLIPPWQGPDEHSHFAYAALLDKRGLDDKQVQSRQQAGKDGDEALINAVTTSMNRHDFSRYISWSSAPGAPVVLGYTLFQELRQQPPYYWLCAAAFRAARAVGIPADPYTNPEVTLYVMRGVSLALGLLVVVLAWLAGVLLGGSQHPWLRLLLPLTVALLPMHTFVASVANNDILAELAVSVLFVTLVALFRWPTGWRGVMLVALAVALTLATTKTKSTALAASVPLLALGLVMWLGLIVSRLARRSVARGSKRRMVVVQGVFIMLVLSASAVAGFAIYRPENSAAGWSPRDQPFQRVAHMQSATAHQGSYVIQLGPGNRDVEASQVLVPAIYHPALKVTFSGWARLAPSESVPANRTMKALASVEQGSRPAGTGEVTLGSSDEWVPITVTARVSEGAEQITLYLYSKAGERAVQFDDMSLDVSGIYGSWRDAIYTHGLLNPSAEIAGIGLRPQLARILPGDIGQMADTLVNPQPYNRYALWAYFADAQYRSFWGNFGWVSIPLPEIVYTLLDIVCALALLGLASLALRSTGHSSRDRWLGLISLAALVLAVLIGFARQGMLLVIGQPAYPQGRYLFVLIIPTVWLLLSGIWEFWSCLWRWARKQVQIREAWPMEEQRVRDKHQPLPSVLAWSAWFWTNAIFAFAAYCVLSLVAPFYYG